MIKTLVALPMHKGTKEKFIERFPECDFEFVYRKELNEQHLRGKEVVLGNPKPEWLRNADSLKWIQLHSAGNDVYIKEPGLLDGIVLTNASGCYSLAISEYMVAMTLAKRLKLFDYDRDMRMKKWTDKGTVFSAEGAVILSVGMGSIGGEYARKMKALGSYVIGIRRGTSEIPDYCDELHTIDELDDLLPRADVVALSLPSTAESRGLFDMEKFKLMRSSAIIINIGRGSAVVQKDLTEALKNGIISGACLDVFEREPLDENDPIWDCENAVLTPHMSGGWHLYSTLENVAALAMRNLRKYINGEKLENIVDLKRGY